MRWLSEILLPGLVVLACVARPAVAQTLGEPNTPRRQFMTITLDGMYNVPLHFQEFPLEQLVDSELNQSQLPGVDFLTPDGVTSIEVQRYRQRTRGFGLIVYPFGAGNGASLAVRASYEELPAIELDIVGDRGSERYALTDGRAYDIGVGIIVSDRASGWGLGSHAFVTGGLGRITGERGDGSRVFGEGGGGISFGPVGLQLAVKFAYNRLQDPRPHDFFTVPVTLRSTLSF